MLLWTRVEDAGSEDADSRSCFFGFEQVVESSGWMRCFDSYVENLSVTQRDSRAKQQWTIPVWISDDTESSRGRAYNNNILKSRHRTTVSSNSMWILTHGSSQNNSLLTRRESISLTAMAARLDCRYDYVITTSHECSIYDTIGKGAWGNIC